MNLYHCEYTLSSRTGLKSHNLLKIASSAVQAYTKLVIPQGKDVVCQYLHVRLVSRNPTKEEIEKFS